MMKFLESLGTVKNVHLVIDVRKVTSSEGLRDNGEGA